MIFDEMNFDEMNFDQFFFRRNDFRQNEFDEMIGNHKYLPRQYYEILKSYITDRFFRVKFEDEYSDLKKN